MLRATAKPMNMMPNTASSAKIKIHTAMSPGSWRVLGSGERFWFVILLMSLLSLRQVQIEFRKLQWQLCRVADDYEVAAAEYIGQVFAGLVINGDAEGGQPGSLRFLHRHACIFHAVTPFVDVQIVRLAIGQQQQDFLMLMARLQ